MTEDEDNCWVCGEGPIPCKCMIIGEAPGPDECKALRPFIGKAGKFLRQALEGHADDPDQIRISNIAKSFPGRDAQGDISPPSPAQIQRELPYLIDEISKVQPEWILALGTPAIEELTGYKTVQDARGYVRLNGLPKLLPKFGHQALVIPTWHPSYIMQGYGRKDEGEWRIDIERFVTACKSTITSPN